MDQKVYFRVATIGGYNKSDVKKYLGEVQAKFDVLKMEKATQYALVQKEYQELEEKYDDLKADRDQLKKESDIFHISKETIIKLELDAHMRAKELAQTAEEEAKEVKEKAVIDAENTLEKAKEEARKMIESAEQEAISIKENYILKAQSDLQSIKLIQEELDSMTTIIATKNKEVQRHIEQFEAVVQRENEE